MFAQFRRTGHMYGLFKTLIKMTIWWLVELPMWLTDSFSVTFLEGGGDSVHTR